MSPGADHYLEKGEARRNMYREWAVPYLFLVCPAYLPVLSPDGISLVILCPEVL